MITNLRIYIIMITLFFFSQLTYADVPTFRKIVHLPVYLDVEMNLDFINRARLANYDTIVIGCYDRVRFESLPWLARPNAISKEQLMSIVKYAKRSGLDVVPEIPLLTHQENLFNKMAKYRFNSYTYNPTAAGLYEDVFKLIDEVISIFQPSSFHIGHDEVFGIGTLKDLLPKGEKALTAEQFLTDVIKIHDYLRKKGLEVWMWGDSLLDPSMVDNPDKHYHGNAAYSKIVDRLPKDIVICDWHYHTSSPDSSLRGGFPITDKFPSVDFFVSKGFRVIGATWNEQRTTKNFTSYITNLRSKQCIGMMASTWYHKQTDYDKVKNIIDYSSEIFWNAGRDK